MLSRNEIDNFQKWFYIVSVLECVVHSRVHVVVVEGHEEGVDDDAQRDEQVDEGSKMMKDKYCKKMPGWQFSDCMVKLNASDRVSNLMPN